MQTTSILFLRAAPVLMVLCWQPSSAQPAQPVQPAQPLASETVRSRVIYSGNVPAQGDKALAVDYRRWSIAPGTTLKVLPLDAKGDVLVELRSGKLTTISGDKREVRRTKELWVVREGEQMAFVTEDDTVILYTIAVDAR
jgi:hypothetical protein